MINLVVTGILVIFSVSTVSEDYLFFAILLVAVVALFYCFAVFFSLVVLAYLLTGGVGIESS